MQVADVLTDAFGRIREGVARVLADLDDEALGARLDPDANSIAWLVWHLTRVQDDHVADAFGVEQVWTQGWAERFGLPLPPGDTGWGHTSDEVATLSGIGADLLLGYHEATWARTVGLLAGVTEGDLDRIVDRRWNPPVSLGVRLVSVIGDDLQHVGQAAYAKGMLASRAR